MATLAEQIELAEANLARLAEWEREKYRAWHDACQQVRRVSDELLGLRRRARSLAAGPEAAALAAHLTERHPGIGQATGPTGMYPEGRPAEHLAADHRLAHERSQDHEHRSCGCPVEDGMIRHQRSGCTDPVVDSLGWYAAERTLPAQPPDVAVPVAVPRLRRMGDAT